MDSEQWVFTRDAEWRDALRRVSLVAELDVDDDDLDRAVTLLGALLRVNSPYLVRRRLPAFFVVALTAVGMREWQAGTFYPHVAAALRIEQDVAERLTREFQDALRVLGLPTFEEAEGLRWVTPVLLHGAVPLDHLDELLELLARRRRRDASLDGESFVDWACLSPGALVGQPKALERFLRFGGDFAPDFVSRVIDLTDGEPAALPRRVEQRLRDLLADGIMRVPGRRQARASLGRTSAGAIVLRLPPVRPLNSERQVQWRVSLDGRTRTIEASVPYERGRETTDGVVVGIDLPVRTVTVERDDQSASLPLVRKEDPLLIFDERGDFVAPTAPCPSGRVVLMWPGGDPEDVTVREAGETGWSVLPIDLREVPYGWEGWSAGETELRPGQSVRLRAGPARRVRPDTRARLLDPSALPALTTHSGLPVFARRPTLVLPFAADEADWSVTVTDAAGELLARFTPPAAECDPLHGIAAPFDGEVTVTVRGPLGRGSTRKIAIAEGVAVTLDPPYRSLRPSGLPSATVALTRGIQTLARVGLTEAQISREVELDSGLRLRVEPPHAEFAVVFDGQGPNWSITPTRITPDDVPDASVAVRGLPRGTRPWLVLESGEMTQQVSPIGGDRVTTSARFSLSSMADHARQVGAGTLWLVAGDRFPVAQLRPRRLAEAVVLDGDVMRIDTEIATDLEVTIHRLVAPWEPGRIVPVLDGTASVDPLLTRSGPLRVRVRVTNEWAPEPAGPVPSPGRDVFDLPDVPWDPDAERPEQRELIAYLLDAAPDPDHVPPLRTHELALALGLLDVAPTLRQVNDTPARLQQLLTARPASTVEACLSTDLSSDELCAGLVGSGIVSEAAAESSLPLDVIEALLPRSPLAAVIAASAQVAADPNGPAAQLVAETVGDEYTHLLDGLGRDSARLGRFETAFLDAPAMVKVWYEQLEPVPGLLLDEDTRIAAAFHMWQARTRLEPQARYAMGAIARIRRVVEEERPDLLDLLDARRSGDGVLALPMLTMALALAARLAAHGNQAANHAYEPYRFHHLPLARVAATMCSIDLIRADAAVSRGPR